MFDECNFCGVADAPSYPDLLMRILCFWPQPTVFEYVLSMDLRPKKSSVSSRKCVRGSRGEIMTTSYARR